MMKEKIKRRLNSDNAGYHSAKNLLYFRMLSKSIKDRITKIIIIPVVLYGPETFSLTLRGENKLKVLENNAQKKIFGPKKDEATGGSRKLHNEKLVTCNVRQI
jgi:hypothetical protein